MNWGEISKTGSVLCRVQMRRGQRQVKPECESLEGRVFWLRPLWWIEQEDVRYPGEVALEFPRDRPPEAIAWIASGDVQPLITPFET